MQSKKYIPEKRTIPFMSEIFENKNKELISDSDIQNLFLGNNIFTADEQNIEEIFEKFQKSSAPSDFITKCIEYELKIRPKQKECLFSLLSMVSNVSGYTPSDILLKEDREKLIQKGIIKGTDEINNESADEKILKIIMEDSAEKFSTLINSDDPDRKFKISEGQSIYYVTECDHEVTYMQLMAFFGSVRCFKRALIEGSFDCSNLSKYAIAGGNNEIIHLIEQNGYKFDDCFETAVKYHRNDLSDWLLNHYKCEIFEISKTIEYFNFPAFFFLYKNNIYSSDSSIIDSSILIYECGLLPLFKLVLDNSSKKIIKNKDGETIMHIICSKGNLNVLKYLIDLYGNINVRDKNGSTLLHVATQCGHFDIIKYLLDQKMSVDSKDKMKRTPLHLACMYCCFDIIKYFVDKKSSIAAKDKMGRTPFHYACEHCSIDVVQYLINNGSNIEEKDINNSTPLLIAFKNKDHNVAKFLIDKGANIKAKDSFGKTALHLACESSTLDVVKKLVELGLDIEEKDHNENIPLHFACQFNTVDVVQYLIGLGADKEARNHTKNTPLINAARNSDFNVAKYLIELGVNLEAKDDFGKTALQYACFGEYINIVKCLVENGADIESRDNEGRTALHCTCLHKDCAIAKYLIEKGANKRAKNNEGNTPYDEAYFDEVADCMNPYYGYEDDSF